MKDRLCDSVLAILSKCVHKRLKNFSSLAFAVTTRVLIEDLIFRENWRDFEMHGFCDDGNKTCKKVCFCGLFMESVQNCHTVTNTAWPGHVLGL